LKAVGDWHLFAVAATTRSNHRPGISPSEQWSVPGSNR
jgi:hypothetical protein